MRGAIRREELIDLLWGEAPEERARNSFRQALHRVRTALGDDVLPQSRELVTFAPDAVSVDRDDFLNALRAGRMEQACTAYAGDFLHGFEVGEPAFDQWADAERLQLAQQFDALLLQQARAAFDAGSTADALPLIQQLAIRAPYDEDAALLEASIHLGAGHAAAAASSLRRFAERLHLELNHAASPRVQELLARVERTGSAHPRTRSKTLPGDGPRITDTAALPPSPFIGRAVELGQIMARIRALQDEVGSALLITGDRGVGKSRLFEEAVERGRAFGPTQVYRGRERALGGAVPYASVAEALRGALRAPGISGASQHLLAEAARLLPELRDAFDLPEVASEQDDASRIRLFEGIASLVEAIAYERPVMLVLDDLHLASSSTLALLGYLIQRLRGAGVLFVMGARDGSGDSGVRRLAEVGGVSHLPLQPLNATEVDALVRALLGAAGSEAVVDQITASAAGLPGRVAELAARIIAGESLIALPERAHDVRHRRLMLAEPAHRRLFFAAALLQRPAPLRLLAAAAHLPEAAAYDGALALERLALLAQSDGEYRVAHDATADLLEEMGGAGARALLAGWAAEALTHAGGSHAELAELYALAGQQDHVFTHARAAALHAATLGAESEAHRLLRQALAVAPDAVRRGEIEQLLDGFGYSSSRLLPGIGERSPNSESDEGALRTHEQSTDPRPSSRWRVWASTPRPSPLRWRVGLGALAALVAALVALNIRTRVDLGGTLIFGDPLLVVRHGLYQEPEVELVAARIPATGLPTWSPSIRQHYPAWADSITIPWINARPSPDRQFVAVERMTAAGTDLYVISANRRDTAAFITGGGDDIALDWAPDSRALLLSRARTLSDGSLDTDLYSYRLASPGVLAPIDTAARRAATEAAWSPDGSHVAWVARVGDDLHRDIFVSRADGSGMRRIAPHPSEDYNISWSPDAGLLFFTSTRFGDADLFAFERATVHLWRLTNSVGQDDHARVSPDGKLVAFESTRDGGEAVYVMPALGGTVRRATAPGHRYSLVGWTVRPPPRLERLRVVGGTRVNVGDSLLLRALALDQLGDVTPLQEVFWSVSDTAILRIVRSDSSTSSVQRIVGRRVGLVAMIATVPGWRADTLTLRVGSGAAELIRDDFSTGLDTLRWDALGAPTPITTQERRGQRAAILLRGALGWESGILSRDDLPLAAGLKVEVAVRAAFDTGARSASTLRVALVVPPDEALLVTAPRFTSRVAATWSGDAQRITYSADGEAWSESARSLSISTEHRFRFDILADGRVAFYLDGRLRWTSTLRVASGGAESRTRLWIGGRATGPERAVTTVRATLRD